MTDRLFKYGIGMLVLAAFLPRILDMIGGGFYGSDITEMMKMLGAVLIAAAIYKEVSGNSLM